MKKLAPIRASAEGLNERIGKGVIRGYTDIMESEHDIRNIIIIPLLRENDCLFTFFYAHNNKNKCNNAYNNNIMCSETL